MHRNKLGDTGGQKTPMGHPGSSWSRLLKGIHGLLDTLGYQVGGYILMSKYMVEKLERKR